MSNKILKFLKKKNNFDDETGENENSNSIFITIASEKSELSDVSARNNPKSFTDKKSKTKKLKKYTYEDKVRSSSKDISPKHINLDKSSQSTSKKAKKSVSNNFINAALSNQNINELLENLKEKLHIYDTQLVGLLEDKKESHKKIVLLEEENKKLNSETNQKLIKGTEINNIMEEINIIKTNLSKQKQIISDTKNNVDDKFERKILFFRDILEGNNIPKLNNYTCLETKNKNESLNSNTNNNADLSLKNTLKDTVKELTEAKKEIEKLKEV